MSDVRLPVGDVELAARWIGEPAPRALVFLHEGLGSIAQWHGTPAAISTATGLPAFLYERPGHGSSTPIVPPRPLTYMHDEAARLPVVLAAAGITEPILVGHSDGASIAIIAAGSGLVAPRALVVIAPHVFVEKISIASIAAAAVAYRTGDLRERLAKYHADVDGMFWGWNRAWLDPAFRDWNIEAMIEPIRAPILIVQGERDEYGTMAQVFAIRELAQSVTTLLVPNAGHSPFRDDPEAVHTRVADFVATSSR